MAAWLSSTGISHHRLLPHTASIHLSTVNSSLCPGIAPRSLRSRSQLLSLPGDLCPCPGYVWLRQGLSVLIPFRLPQISCFTLSLKCFSSNPDSCPDAGIRPLLQFPHPLRAGSGVLTLPFFPLVPSSYQVLPLALARHKTIRGGLPSISLLRWIVSIALKKALAHLLSVFHASQG